MPLAQLAHVLAVQRGPLLERTPLEPRVQRQHLGGGDVARQRIPVPVVLVVLVGSIPLGPARGGREVLLARRLQRLLQQRHHVERRVAYQPRDMRLELLPKFKLGERRPYRASTLRVPR